MTKVICEIEIGKRVFSKMQTMPDFPNAGARLRHARSVLGLTLQTVAQRLEVATSTVSRWETEGQVTKIIALAFEALWNIRETWIMDGTGEMLIADGRVLGLDGVDPRGDCVFENRDMARRDDFALRPLIVGAATCGPGGSIVDPGPNASLYALRMEFVQRILAMCGGGRTEDLFFLLCRGESMTPTIRDKEIVLLHSGMSCRMRPANNGIYLVRRDLDDEEARVKRLQLDHKGKRLVLSSDNSAYPPTLVDLDGVALPDLVLGRVVWVGRYLVETDPPSHDW